jgi:DNA-directed RNA polymerases I, II, and III subunit RPABC2
MSKKQSTENLSYFSDDENENEEDDNESMADSEIEMDEVDIAEAAGESDNEGEAEEDGAPEEEKEGDEDSVLIDVGDEEDDDDDEEPDENYLQKFDEEINRNYILDNHPECAIHSKTEIAAMVQVVRDENGNITDDLHRTLPFLTKYERARILGQRASQINAGAPPFVANVPANILDGHLIAEMELELKSIPFIIRRPLPNGGCEYWRVKDLQNILA